MTDLTLLASELDVSERTLRRAVGQGTLHGERLSPRRLRLTAAEKQYIRRSWELLSTLRQALRTESNVRFALLFGSAARGEDTVSSDVDLLVDMRDSSLVARVDLAMKLEAILGRQVDITTLEAAAGNPELLATAVREGRVIVDREERWPRLDSELERLTRRAEAHTRRDKQRALAAIDELLSNR
jgi:predicted nucleotidyltransferase